MPTYTLPITESSRMLVLALGFAATATVNAAGEHDHGGHGDVAGQAAEADEADRTVEIEARDIAFEPQEISVAAGETVHFVIENTGRQPHDFTLGPPAAQESHRKEMEQMMKEHGMDGMAEGHGDEHGHGNAVMIPPGETREITWTFEEADDFEFGCNVPGHYEAGMKGPVRFEG